MNLYPYPRRYRSSGYTENRPANRLGTALKVGGAFLAYELGIKAAGGLLEYLQVNGAINTFNQPPSGAGHFVWGTMLVIGAITTPVAMLISGVSDLRNCAGIVQDAYDGKINSVSEAFRDYYARKSVTDHILFP